MDALRVVVITPGLDAHSKHLCVELVRRHDVAGIVHPSARTELRSRMRKARRRIAASGVTMAGLAALGRARTPFLGYNWNAAYRAAEERFFPGADADYADVAAPLAHHVPDVNDARTIEQVRQLEPDVAVCLGGPIYRRPLIEACRLMLNFHSGVSPIYNGTSTILFAFANGHVHLCGGTLMTMSPVVDGGDILAHYLPEIGAEDTPATLFMKTVRGAVECYDRVLRHLEQGQPLARCAQPAPLFYCTGADWTVDQSHRVRRHLQRQTAASAARPEDHVDYYRLDGDEAARAAVRGTLERLVGW